MKLSFFLSFIIHRFFDFVFQEDLIIHRVVNFSIYVIIHVIKISIIKHYVNTSNDVRHSIKLIDLEIFEIFEHFFFNRSTRSFRLFHSTYFYFENFLYSTTHRCNSEICFYYFVALNLESSKYIKFDQSFDYESFSIRFFRSRLLLVLK
jgi:hypothetical protein